MAMDSSTECVSTPQTPLVDANKIVDISSDQLQSTSLGTPAKALEPAGLSDSREVATVDENDKTSRLRLRLQRLQRQLTQQQLYRDATHIILQRAAQTEIDLDHTAAMLCDEMTQGAANNAAMLRLQELYELEQNHCKMAMAAVSSLNLQLYIHNQELRQSDEQLLTALAKLKSAEAILAEHNWSPQSSSASIHPAAAMGDMPIMSIPASPSAPASSAPAALASSHVSFHCSAVQSQGPIHLRRQRSTPCW